MPRWPSQLKRKFGPKLSPEQLDAARDAERKRVRALSDARRNRAFVKAKAKFAPKPNPTRKPRISPQVDRALDVLADAAVAGERITISEAAQRAGMRRESLSLALRRDVVTARAAVKVRERLGGAALIKAGGRLEGLIDATSEYVQLEAAKHVLAIAGIKPREQGLAAAGGVTINLTLMHAGRPAQPVDITPIRAQIGTQPAQLEHAKAQAHDEER